MKQKSLPTNYAIQVDEVCLINEDGNRVGTVATPDAIHQAKEVGLDLVLVAPQANPPIARLMDYGKYQYQQAKKHKPDKKQRRRETVKEIRLTPDIAHHDFKVKSRHIKRLLDKGHPVDVTVFLSGRRGGSSSFQEANKERGRDTLQQVIDLFYDQLEETPDIIQQGRRLSVRLIKREGWA